MERSDSIIELLQQGGPFAMFAVFVGVAGAVTGLIGVILLASSHRSAKTVGLVTLMLASAAAALGVVGTVSGKRQMEEALVHVSPVDADTIRRQGMKEAQNASLFGFFAALLPLLLGAAAAFGGGRQGAPAERTQGLLEPQSSQPPNALAGAAILTGVAVLAAGLAFVQWKKPLPPLPYGLAEDDIDGQRLASAVDVSERDPGQGCGSLDRALQDYWQATDLHEWPRQFRQPLPQALADKQRLVSIACVTALSSSGSGDWPPSRLLESPLLQDDAQRGVLQAAATKTASDAVDAPPAPTPEEDEDEQPRTGLNASTIRTVIGKQTAPIRACYERELAKNPNLEGKLVVSFSIGADGSVVSAEERSTPPFPSAEVTRCVLERMKRLKFPAAEGGGTTSVNFPFIFKSAG